MSGKTVQFDVSQHKRQLLTYFNGEGFERWSAIYGDSDDLTNIRRSIREGHARMLDVAMGWLAEHNLPAGSQVLDAGCGTGLFSLAMAAQGYHITAVDIAPQMVHAASQHALNAGVRERIRFVAGDLEVVGGSYDAVACFDVLIHYPEPAFVPLCSRLAQMSRGPLIITYAPYNRVLAMKHWVGGHFPRSDRRTTIAMIPDHVVQRTLESVGMHVHRSTRISHGFYHVKLLEARR